MDSGLSAYQTALDALFARTGTTSKFGLERTFALLDVLGNPHRRIPAFHVAGTNGKGSVVAMLYALLRAKGLSVGRYTSPHLIDFRERVVVDDAPIGKSYVLDFITRWSKEAESGGATFFEITTAMAFDYFARAGVDVAIIETGLGGRLDATNVIHPLVSGVTSISIDHQQYLGETETEIAREKAGIFKRGVPGVIGAMSTEARVSIYRAAAEAGVGAVIEADKLYSTSDVSVHSEGTAFTLTCGNDSMPMRVGLIGAAQAANVSVAVSMLRAAGGSWAVSLDEARLTLPRVRLPGRFQRIENYVLDVAHNPDGMKSLVSALAAVRPRRPVAAVLGVLNDKDWQQMIRVLAPHVDRLILVAPPSAPRDRAWNPDEALAFARGSQIEASVDWNFADTIERTALEAGTVVVTGSFHTVGDALGVLGQSAF